MFYRQGGSDTRINAQQDEVYTDAIGGATGWLPVSKGNIVAVNVARASIVFESAAQSRVTKTGVAPEVQVLMEMKFQGDGEPWPIDQWQNMVVATFRRVSRDGWARLRVVNINNLDGTGVAMAMQVNRTGDVGAGS
jgi:hypothetical protein